jgi:hypothetical protein
MQNGSLTRDIPSFGMLVGGWLPTFALLAPASLPLSSLCGQSQQPDWACFWLCAHAGGVADVAKAINQTGLASGSVLMTALRAQLHRKLHFGVLERHFLP